MHEHQPPRCKKHQQQLAQRCRARLGPFHLCVAVLKASPGDQDALRVRALLLIEVESFEEALRAASSPALQEPMVFEKVGGWVGG